MAACVKSPKFRAYPKCGEEYALTPKLNIPIREDDKAKCPFDIRSLDATEVVLAKFKPHNRLQAWTKVYTTYNSLPCFAFVENFNDLDMQMPAGLPTQWPVGFAIRWPTGSAPGQPLRLTPFYGQMNEMILWTEKPAPGDEKYLIVEPLGGQNCNPVCWTVKDDIKDDNCLDDAIVVCNKYEGKPGQLWAFEKSKIDKI